MSLFIALLIWFNVVFNVDTQISKEVYNVPVVINTQDSEISRLGLYLVTENKIAVNVEITGARAVVGNVTGEDIEVDAVLSSVTGPGSYDLRLEGMDVNEKGFEITSIYPATVRTRFDEMVSKTFPLDVSLNELEIPDGFLMGKEFVTPENVTVSGPATEMEYVASCRGDITFTEPLTMTENIEIPIEVCDASGKKLDSPYLKTDVQTAVMTIPILKKKVLPIHFDFVDVPADFDINTIENTITPPEIEVAGPPTVINGMTELHLGYVDLRSVEPGVRFFYSAALPDDVMSVDNITEVNVQFGNEALPPKA
jgi:YbbR domain-containing protein